MGKERYLYLDMMRGITMMLVIYHHITTFCATAWENNLFDQFCLHFRMPLFFFVSGFLAYSPNYNLSLLQKRVSNRIVRQLWPTLLLLFPMSYIWWFGYTEALLDLYKHGYWFTIVLFEIFCLFSIITWIGHRGGKKLLTLLYIAIICISVFMTSYVKTHWTTEWQNDWIRLCSFQTLINRIHHFFFGALVRMYFNEIKAYIFRPFVMIVVLIAYILICHAISMDKIKYFTPLLIIIILYAFYLGGNRMATTRVGSLLSYFGRNTLQIYLLHYFIIYTFMTSKMITPLVDSLRHWYIEIPVLFSMSVIIASCCMMFDKLLDKIKLKQFIFPSIVPQIRRKDIQTIPKVDI